MFPKVLQEDIEICYCDKYNLNVVLMHVGGQCNQKGLVERLSVFLIVILNVLDKGAEGNSLYLDF